VCSHSSASERARGREGGDGDAATKQQPHTHCALSSHRRHLPPSFVRILPVVIRLYRSVFAGEDHGRLG